MAHGSTAVCDRDSSTGVRLYIDGVPQNATADPTSIAGIDIADSTAFAIGSRQDTSLAWMWDFLGRVAAVCVWKRVLTETEIGRLRCEPFALFARRRTPTCFALPAGAIVDLAGSAHGVSSTSATLQVMRGLSGVSTARATATAVLRKAGSPTFPGERPRLRDALSNGMTSTAFKWGTMLTQGWFWACRRGGTAVYRGPSVAEVDFNHILQVAEPQSREIVLPAHLSHPPDSTHCYLVRRFNGRGDPERTTAAAVMVRIGPDGRLARPAPNAVLGLKGEQIGGHRLRLTWFYPPLDQEAAPQEFHIYWEQRRRSDGPGAPPRYGPIRRVQVLSMGNRTAQRWSIHVCHPPVRRRSHGRHVVRECCGPDDGPGARSTDDPRRRVSLMNR